MQLAAKEHRCDDFYALLTGIPAYTLGARRHVA